MEKYSAKTDKKPLFLIAYEKQLTNITDACKDVKIHRDTYYEWRKRFPDFDKDCKDIEEGLIEIGEKALYKNVKSGMQSAVEFFLKNRRTDKWKEKQRIEHSGSIEEVHYYLPKRGGESK